MLWRASVRQTLIWRRAWLENVFAAYYTRIRARLVWGEHPIAREESSMSRMYNPLHLLATLSRFGFDVNLFRRLVEVLEERRTQPAFHFEFG